MSDVTRVGDSHSGTCSHGADCCPHSVSGEFTEGSPNVFVNGKAVVRVGDSLEHNCPHCGTGEASGGSSTVFANGQAVVREGDPVSYPGGSGTVNQGSSNVSAGG